MSLSNLQHLRMAVEGTLVCQYHFLRLFNLWGPR